MNSLNIEGATPEQMLALQNCMELFLTYKPLSNHQTGPPIMKVGGHWFPVFMAAYWPKIFHLNVRDSDVLITGFPISGTPYLKYIVEQIMKVIRPGFKPRRPLGVLENVLTFDGDLEAHDKLASEPSPRILWTHLPLNLLPHDALDTKAKFLYCRCDAKDNAALTYQHYVTATSNTTGFNDTFEEFIHNRFLKGEVVGGPYPEHVNAFLNLQKQHNEKVFVVSKEDLEKEDTRRQLIKKIGAFLGDAENLTDDEVERITKETSYEWLRGVDAAKMEENAFKGLWKKKDEAFWDAEAETSRWAKFTDSKELADKFDAEITSKLN